MFASCREAEFHILAPKRVSPEAADIWPPRQQFCVEGCKIVSERHSHIMWSVSNHFTQSDCSFLFANCKKKLVKKNPQRIEEKKSSFPFSTFMKATIWRNLNLGVGPPVLQWFNSSFSRGDSKQSRFITSPNTGTSSQEASPFFCYSSLAPPCTFHWLCIATARGMHVPKS